MRICRHTNWRGGCQKALADAKVNPEEVDLIIVTTETPDYLSPSMSCLIQSEIGATRRLPLISMLHAPDSFMACPWPISLLSQAFTNMCYLWDVKDFRK